MFCLNIKSQHIPARYFSFCILLTVLLVTLSIRSLQGELFITDAQYMVAAGRWIIANGHLPTTDPLSIHSELTYICQQYPICILVAVLYDTFGEMSVRLFFALLDMVAVLFIWYQTFPKAGNRIDCPPSLGLVTRNAMVAADELIVPVIPNRSSLKGFTNIQKCVNSVRRNKRLNPNLRIAGIVVNMFDGRTSLSRGVVNELPSIARAANTKMFHTIIRKCEAVNKAQSANVSIFDYDPNCNAVADFTDFVNEYLEGEDY